MVDFLKNNISNIKYIFSFVYLIYFSLTFNTFVDAYCDFITSILYTALTALGILIIMLDFFFSGLLFRFKYSWILILFYLSCLISIALNISYDPIGNIKVIVWMIIQSFLLSTVNCEYKDEFHTKRYKYIIEAVSFVWFAEALISLGMFFTSSATLLEVNENGASKLVRVGFTEGRLFGIFNDPNYASMCIVFTMLLILGNMFTNKEGKLLRLYHILLLAIDFLYVVLSGSRMTELCVYIISLFVGFFVVFNFLSKRNFKRLKKVVFSVVSAIVALVLAVVVFAVSDYTMKVGYIFASSISGDYDENHNYEEDLIRPDVEYNDDVTNNRLAIYTDYFELSTRQPVFGIGPRNGLHKIKEYMPDSFVARKEYSFHNGFLALWVGSGLVGALLMLAFIVLNVSRIISYLFRRGGKGDKYYIKILLLTMLLGSATVCAVPLMAIFFCNSIFDMLFWFAFGYTLSLIRISEPERYTKEPTAFRLSAVFRFK